MPKAGGEMPARRAVLRRRSPCWPPDEQNGDRRLSHRCDDRREESSAVSRPVREAGRTDQHADTTSGCYTDVNARRLLSHKCDRGGPITAQNERDCHLGQQQTLAHTTDFAESTSCRPCLRCQEKMKQWVMQRGA
jgi:hypothetical protein